MVRPRFSLRTLLLGTAFIAAFCATLRFPNQWLASAWYLSTLAVLLFSIVATSLSGQRRRAFWLGFAVCGWGYFYLTFSQSEHIPDVASKLATTRASTVLYWALNPNTGWAIEFDFDIQSSSFNRPITSRPMTSPPSAGSMGGVFSLPSYYVSDDGASFDGPIEPLDVPASQAPGLPGSGDGGQPDGVAPAYYPGVVSTPQLTAPAVFAGPAARLSLGEYVCLGNLLWTLLFAYCGGIAGRWLHDTREQFAAC